MACPSSVGHLFSLLGVVRRESAFARVFREHVATTFSWRFALEVRGLHVQGRLKWRKNAIAPRRHATATAPWVPRQCQMVVGSSVASSSSRLLSSPRPSADPRLAQGSSTQARRWPASRARLGLCRCICLEWPPQAGGAKGWLGEAPPSQPCPTPAPRPTSARRSIRTFTVGLQTCGDMHASMHACSRHACKHARRDSIGPEIPCCETGGTHTA